MAKKLTSKQLLTRYALTGGAIELYFGYFFRPARQPSLIFALGLAVLIALVTGVIKVIRERPSLLALLKASFFTFIKATLFLILLELRHPVYDAGGKLAVTIFMGLMGVLAGLWYAREQIRKERGKS